MELEYQSTNKWNYKEGLDSSVSMFLLNISKLYSELEYLTTCCSDSSIKTCLFIKLLLSTAEYS